MLSLLVSRSELQVSVLHVVALPHAIAYHIDKGSHGLEYGLATEACRSTDAAPHLDGATYAAQRVMEKLVPHRLAPPRCNWQSRKQPLLRPAPRCQDAAAVSTAQTMNSVSLIV